MKVITALVLASALLFTATHADAKKKHKGSGHHKKPAATKDAGKTAEPKK